MKLPSKDLSLIEKQFSSNGPTRCKAELFIMWMKQTPNASWELIAAALEKVKEPIVAERIRNICHAARASLPPSTSQKNTKPPTVRVIIEKNQLLVFTDLEMKFTSLVMGLAESLKEKPVPLKELKKFLIIRLDLRDGDLSQVTTIDDLIQQIRPHFCLFNTVILKNIAEMFVVKPLKQQLEKYECELEKFTETAEISLLKKVKFLDQYSSADMPQVIFKLTGFWPDITIKRFQKFVEHVFEANSSALTHIRVTQGCICVTWYARKSAFVSLAAQAQEKVQFMQHVGVLSLSIGDTVILEQEETKEEETDLSSALVQAVTADCTEAVDFLLFLGADPNCTSGNGTTPLILACSKNFISIAKLLLRAKANVNAQNKRGFTALKIVCDSKTPKKELVKLLVQSGAQFVILGEKITALELATKGGHVAVVQYLASKGAPVNVQDTFGVTALMLACLHRHLEIAHILLNHGADLNVQDMQDHTALHFACFVQMKVGVELLLSHGANHSLRDKEGLTPLMHACKKSSHTIDPSILVVLLKAGADPNARSKKGETALMAAAQNDGMFEDVKILLNAKADVNIQNDVGSTALHVAAEYGFFSISKLLLESGAQAFLIDSHGKTPLDYALDNNHHDVCHMLLENMSSNPLPAIAESSTVFTASDLSLFENETIEQKTTEQELIPHYSPHHSSVSSLSISLEAS